MKSSSRFRCGQSAYKPSEKAGLKRVFLCLMLVVSVLSGACTKTGNLEKTENKKIALIVKTIYGYYWGTVKLGADTAAREFNVNVDFNGPGNEQDVDGQIKLVEQALSENVDALILAASDYEGLVKVTEKAHDKRIPVIIIDSEVESGEIESYIATDNIDAGNKAGKAVVELAGKSCKVAIINFVKGSRNAEQREEGLLDTLSAYPGIQVVAKEYCSSDRELAFQLANEILAENRDTGVFVTFNDVASEGVADAVDQLNLAGQVKIVAFDNTPKEIDYLEKGVIQALIIQNPFSMGYLSVKYAVEALNGNTIPEYYNTGSYLITSENMYMPEYQKILFPIVK